MRACATCSCDARVCTAVLRALGVCTVVYVVLGSTRSHREGTTYIRSHLASSSDSPRERTNEDPGAPLLSAVCVSPEMPQNTAKIRSLPQTPPKLARTRSRAMHGDVLVALLETMVLLDEVQIAPDHHSTLHLHGDGPSLEDLSGDAHRPGKGDILST